MEFREFLKAIEDEVKKYLSEGQEISIQEVRKNNNVILYGMTITSKDSNVVPTIYMEPFLKLYQNDMSMESVARKIWKIYQDSLPKEHINMDFFRDFEKVKDRITYRLINAERNRELLEDIPHIPFWDLAICFTYAYWSAELGDGMILIHNLHMKQWGVDCSKLMAHAEANTRRLFPMRLFSMQEILEQMHTDIDFSEIKDAPLYVLTNSRKIYGASVLLYPETLKFIADKLKDNFYIIPCSIHELIILEESAYKERGYTEERLYKMVNEVNYIELSIEEVLSDHSFFYDRETNQLRQLQTEADPRYVF